MEVYPAIDLYQGKVVRLEQGDYNRCKVYSSNPVEIAQKWENEGARWLHVIDLEGAKSGSIKNGESVKDILESVKLSVQFGGGVRTQKDVEHLFDLGVKRVILGTKALDLAFLKEITQRHGERVALSLDSRGGEVQVEGWLKGTGKSIFEFFRELQNYKLSCLIVTDIEKDGGLKGINTEMIKAVLEKSPHPIISSGGVTSISQIESLMNLPNCNRLNGIIIGKALYEGRISLKEALRVARGGGN